MIQSGDFTTHPSILSESSHRAQKGMTIWGQGMKAIDKQENAGLLHPLFITYHPKSIPYGTRRNLE